MPFLDILSNKDTTLFCSFSEKFKKTVRVHENPSKKKKGYDRSYPHFTTCIVSMP